MGEVLGPKIHDLSGFWALKPYDFGSWTLRGGYRLTFLGRSASCTAAMISPVSLPGYFNLQACRTWTVL